MQKNIWNETFDGIFCIVLESEKKRYQEVLKRLKKAGVGSVNFYRPQRYKSKKNPPQQWGQKGCWLSHQTCVLYAKKKNYKNCLVFESDVDFDFSKIKLQKVIDTYRNRPKDCEIFYLGHMPIFHVPLKNNLIKTFSTCTHAIVYEKEFFNSFLQSSYENSSTQLDSWIMRKSNQYAVSPMICFQNPVSQSNIQTSLRALVTNSGMLMKKICIGLEKITFWGYIMIGALLLYFTSKKLFS